MVDGAVTIIGAGLSGCEAALWLAKHDVHVTLLEQKPKKYSPAHSLSDFCELVCSNSLKATRIGSACGLLKAEAALLGSSILPIAQENSVPAGGALSVQRENFSRAVTKAVKEQPKITVKIGEAEEIQSGITIVATGPLTEGELARQLFCICGGALSYFDAAAPIITAQSLQDGHFFCASRYGRGGDDYINCPLTKEEYYNFTDELIGAKKALLHSFDKPKVYEGCMPIELLAARGRDSLRFGPLKPVGLTDPKTGHRPYANLQLRKEDKEGTRYNLVGCQTNLTFGEQRRVFGMIPALANAEYIRFGVMHRNSFIDSPKVLNQDLSLKNFPNIFICGALTGFEGYSECIASGILAARFVYARQKDEILPPPPPTTMCGALLKYIGTQSKDFEPQGAAMGLLPPLSVREKDKQIRYEKIAETAISEMNKYIQSC